MSSHHPPCLLTRITLSTRNHSHGCPIHAFPNTSPAGVPQTDSCPRLVRYGPIPRGPRETWGAVVQWHALEAGLGAKLGTEGSEVYQDTKQTAMCPRNGSRGHRGEGTWMYVDGVRMGLRDAGSTVWSPSSAPPHWLLKPTHPRDTLTLLTASPFSPLLPLWPGGPTSPCGGSRMTRPVLPLQPLDTPPSTPHLVPFLARRPGSSGRARKSQGPWDAILASGAGSAAFSLSGRMGKARRQSQKGPQEAGCEAAGGK